jgi:hypothetical protein
VRRGPALAQVGFANVTLPYDEHSMHLVILMAHVGLCTWEVEAATGTRRNTFIFQMGNLHFAKHGFHAGASAVEVGAFHSGMRMLAQPLARWLAAWAGLIGWLADVPPRCDDYRSVPCPFPALQIFLILATSLLLYRVFPPQNPGKSGERFAKRGGKTEGGQKLTTQEGLTTFVFPIENDNFPKCAAATEACIITNCIFLTGKVTFLCINNFAVQALTWTAG